MLWRIQTNHSTISAKHFQSIITYRCQTYQQSGLLRFGDLGWVRWWRGQVGGSALQQLFQVAVVPFLQTDGTRQSLLEPAQKLCVTLLFCHTGNSSHAVIWLVCLPINYPSWFVPLGLGLIIRFTLEKNTWLVKVSTTKHSEWSRWGKLTCFAFLRPFSSSTIQTRLHHRHQWLIRCWLCQWRPYPLHHQAPSTPCEGTDRKLAQPGNCQHAHSQTSM